MTGFGRGEGASDGWSWMVEIRSVNGRGLEVRTRLPAGLEALERPIRETVQARLARGQVSVTVQLRPPSQASRVRVNAELLETYRALAGRLAEQGAAPASADGLLGLRGVIDAGEDELSDDDRARLEAGVSASVHEALEELIQSRAEEGAKLLGVLTGQTEAIAGLVDRAEREAAVQAETVRERFLRRLTELAGERPDWEERLVQEAAVLAAKADIREELDRLTAHVAAAEALLQGGPVGRKLDFLMQEFMREANTLCSKSATIELTGVGLELKAVIEQAREQVQNVE